MSAPPASSRPGRNDYGSLTTPDPVSLHRLLAELAEDGVTHAAMEASSHGLDQNRLDGVRLSAAASPISGRDHMDYHPTVEDYMARRCGCSTACCRKARRGDLFPMTPGLRSDPRGDRRRHAVRTVGRKGDFLALKRVEHFRHRQVAECITAARYMKSIFRSPATSKIANALVAAGLAMSTGVSAAAAMAALAGCRRVGQAGTLGIRKMVRSPMSITPQAGCAGKRVTSVRPFTTGRVIVVFVLRR